MVKLTKEEKKMYQIFSLLMGYAIDANITTMKQISIYVAKSTGKFNVNTDCSVSINNESNSYELLLKDGRKIIFSKNSNEFGFVVLKEEKNISGKVIISERIPGDLTTLSVYSEVKIKDNGMYVITFRPNDMRSNSLKFAYINYYTDDEIDWVYEIADGNINNDFDLVAKANSIYPSSDKKDFVVSSKNNNSFDCFSGILNDVMMMIDLLYDNVKVAMNCKILKRVPENKK